MEREKEKITINNYYSLIVIVSAILISNDLVVVVLGVLISSIYLDFLVVSDEYKKNKKDAVFRIGYFTVVNLSLMLSCSYLNLDIGVLSGGKIGILSGLVLNFLTIHFLSTRLNFKTNSYHFDTSKNYFESLDMGKLVLYGTLIFLVLFFLIAYLFYYRVVQYFPTYMFLIVSTITFLYAKRYGVIDLNNMSEKVNKYRFGIGLIVLGILSIWYDWSQTFGMLLVIAGVSFIQFNTTKSESITQENLIYYFTIPSLSVATTLFLLTVSVDNDIFDSKEILYSPYQREIYNSVNNDEKNIENDVYALFESLKSRFKLQSGVEPIVRIKLEKKRKWNFKTEVNLVGEFTYNYDELYLDTIRHYRPGKYRLNDSDVAMAIVDAFQLSVTNYFQNYFEKGTGVFIELDGAADAIRFSENSQTSYRGEYGDILRDQVYDQINGGYENVSIAKGDKLNNSTLAYLRSYGIKTFIKNNINILDSEDTEYGYMIFVEKSRIGPEYRRVAIKVEILDIYAKL